MNNLKSKGDGTDLCCLIAPIRKCLNCGLTLCNDHWWNSARDLLGLSPLPTTGGEDPHAVCPRCFYAKKATSKELESLRTWEIA